LLHRALHLIGATAALDDIASTDGDQRRKSKNGTGGGSWPRT